MGIFDGLKEFYYSLEEKYYGFLDKIEESVPVYSVIDPIDKVVPSFALFILLGLILITAIILGVFAGALLGGNNTLIISVKDTSGPVSGADMIFFKDGDILLSTETDQLGIAKLPGIAEGDTIDIQVSKENYLTYNDSVIIFELPQAKNVTLQKESEAYTFKTIRMVDDLGQAVSKEFTLRFRCADNPYAQAPAPVNLRPSDNGVAVIKVANDCDGLSVDVSNTNVYAEINGKRITSDDFSIYLSEPTAESGTIIANVYDPQGNPIDGIIIELYKHSELVANPNVGPITVNYTFSGQGNFSNVYPGKYVLKTYDESGSYSEQTSGIISLVAGATEQVAINLREDIRGQITVKVVDKTSKSLIREARVKLLIASSAEELTTIKTGENGEAEFNISKDVQYNAIVSADNYQIGRASNLKISETATTIELVKCTPSTCGSLKVKVVDQDDKLVRNATVALYDASTNFVADIDTKTTDINGIAEFFGVRTGNYYAFAFKEGYSGRSDAGYFNSSTSESSEPNLTVTMEVGTGIVRANVKDKLGRAIPFATIGVFDARTNELIGTDFTDANGSKEFELRANRKIYLIVSKENEEVFAKYVTAKKPVIASTIQEFDIALEKPILKDTVEMEFLGLYQGGKRSQNVQAGATYAAKFKVFIPENKDYDELGVHIRTGKDVLMEKDKLLIREVNAPRTSQIRATRFEPEESNLGEEDYDVTVDDAKWVNLYWYDNVPGGIIPGVYEAEAEVFIKESAAISDKLLMNYRIWGESSDGRERFPEDNTVAAELYSNTKQEIFQVGIITLCDTDFCFTATITDLEEDLIESVTDSYTARVFNPYKLQFVITNNSTARIHNNANLRIVNPDETLKFFDYKITNAESTQTSGVVNGFEFQRMDVGNLNQKNTVRLETQFTPQKAINGIINIQLVSDQAIVFEKNLTIVVAAPKELEIDVEPKLYLSGVPNNVTVTVIDKATRLEVDKAIVRLKDKHSNILDWDVTGKDGVAKLTLPAQAPGEKLKIEVEKPNYNVLVKELSVSDELLDINPSQIGVSLNTKNKAQAEDKFSIRNIAPYALTIKDIKLQGNFKNLIDIVTVRNWLESSYKGLTLEAGDQQEFVLKTALTEDAQALSERIDLEGELIIIAGNFGQEWIFKVPVKIAIGLGSEVDDPTCLVVTRSEWTTSTSGTPKRTEFQIQNNCTVGGTPVALQDLEAMIKWNSNQLGEYTLNFGADEVILRPGYFRLMLGTIQAEQTITAILTFTPFGGVNGLADAEIVIQGTNPLDGENQVLQNSIKTQITSVNLAQCINYDKERLVLNQKESGAFTITADESCGEPIEVEVESNLVTSPGRGFTLAPGESQTIEVFAEDNYPGQYAIFISPQFGSDRRDQLTKNLRVIINSPGCWQLSKYEFDVYDDPAYEFDGFDVANLTNGCVEKPVEVRVKTKDFMDSLQDGALWGLASMAAVMLTNWSNPNKTLMGKDKVTETGEELTIPSGEYHIGDDGYIYNSNNKHPDPKIETLINQRAGPELSIGDTITVDGQGNVTIIKKETTAPVTTPNSTTERVASASQQILGIPPIQGFITGFVNAAPRPSSASPRSSTTGVPITNNQTQVQRNGAAGGILGAAGGMVTGILGTNPWAAGILGTVVGTIQAYNSQEDEISFTTLQKDVEIKNVTLVQGAGSVEKKDNEIELTVEGLHGKVTAPVVPQPLVNNPDLISQGIENFRTIFQNATGFITEEARPKYTQLMVTGERHKYKDKTYSKDDFIDEEGGFLGFYDSDVLDKSKTKLEEETAQKLEQRYNLEFNSVPPMMETQETTSLLNCQAGTKTGNTGYDALPKVKFAWNWKEIKEDTCNEENENGIYCDGTQFSIALLQKINQLTDYVADKGETFNCPAPREDQAATNEIGSYDIGIASVSISKNGTEANVIAILENTNPGIINADVTITAVPTAGGDAIECPDGVQQLTVPAGGREEVRCTYPELTEGFYEAKVEITPKLNCENCEDIQATNILSRTFYAGDTGVKACEPYSTSRLDLFLQASGITGTDADKLISMTKFNATLMIDGYSTDFQKDFDVAQNKTFFDAPDWYLDETKGLGVYFKDSKLFGFDSYSQPNYNLPGPGTYAIVIDVEYADGSWQLYDSKGNPNAKINIKMEKLKGAEPDSPFYYLPFDGQVGLEEGRTGYGINYAGDSVFIDNGTNPVRTVEIAGSSPISNGELKVTKSESFAKMQIGSERGVLAKVSRAQQNPTLVFQPS
ncbi:MAG: carboxypeptidase-like regulatory domain-containing protein, partial [archaeon]|nr:carboxypeptidase-like regulatory domain-containing protein [archaeon]